MKQLIIALLFFFFIGHSLICTATTLEEQANAIEKKNNEAHQKTIQEISDIFNKYKESVQITFTEPKVINSNGTNVVIGIDAFVKLTDPNLSSQMSHTFQEYFDFPHKYTNSENGTSYFEISIASECPFNTCGKQTAWNELTKNGLKAEVSVLDSKESIALFGNFRRWFGVYIIENKAFNLTFSISKKNLKLNLTPKVELITTECDKNNIGENSCEKVISDYNLNDAETSFNQYR